jgi:DNA-binding beta-propeller fold protein YncE
MRRSFVLFAALGSLLAAQAKGQVEEPLRLVQNIPMPGFGDGDFDHFAVDLKGHLLFLAAEDNSAVAVLNLSTNTLIRTIKGLKAPHSMVYRSDIKKLFVVDGDAAEIKIYNGDSYEVTGRIPLHKDADSSAFDPSSNYMYVASRGEAGGAPYSLVNIIDTTTERKIDEIRVDYDRLEGIAIEKSGTRLFTKIPSQNSIAVIDRNKKAVVATWSFKQEGTGRIGPIAFDEPGHRLFVTAPNPGRLIVMDSQSGKIVSSLPCVGIFDEAFYDVDSRRLYIAGVPFLNVIQKSGHGDRYDILGQIPTAFHAITGILVPELNRYYLAVNRHGQTPAKVQVYEVIP